LGEDAKVSHGQTQPRLLPPIQKNREVATLEVIAGYLVWIRTLLAASELEKGISGINELAPSLGTVPKFTISRDPTRA
jgi:hypothetical protein